MSDIDIGKLSEAINDKMDKNLVNTNILTNCILKDPQVIDLELNEGNLTLKAGSTVIVPNGFEEDGTTPKFDEVIVETDQTITNQGNQVIFLVYNSTGKHLDTWGINSTYTTTSSTTEIGYWYDTSVNKCYIYSSSGTLYSSDLSFPIAIFTSDSTKITSIDQVFQSVGYIGSTIFVRKGLKVLIPNGKNEDGSLKNIEYITSKVSISDTNTYTFANISYAINSSNFIYPWDRSYYYYRDDINYNWQNYTPAITSDVPICTCSLTSGAISNFKPIGVARTATSVDTHVIKFYTSGTSGYRIWSDGYCEQWGHASSGTQPNSITFLKTFADTNWCVTFGDSNVGWAEAQSRIVKLYTKSTTGMTCTGIFENGTGTDFQFYWRVNGYLAQGQY